MEWQMSYGKLFLKGQWYDHEKSYLPRQKERDIFREEGKIDQQQKYKTH